MSDKDQHQDYSGLDVLAQMLITEDANLSEALRRVAATGCGLLANCKSASVTIIERGRAVTVGSTSDTAQALDDAQYEVGDGPCLTAARDGMAVRIDDIGTDQRWLAFASRALEHDVHSSLSMPLNLTGDDTFGGFNVYGAVADGFSDDDQQLCEAFAKQASIVVSNAQAYWAALTLSQNLTTAMETRAVIEQAKGILMFVHSISPDEAFDMLRERSQRENRKLRDVAVDVVDGRLENE
jgi:GAF domain-containing protein